MAKVIKKAASAPAPAPAPAEEAPAKAARVKLSDMPQAEKDTLCHGLIDEIYGDSGLDQKEKSKRRQRLRNVDKDWRNTYSDYITETYPPPAEEAPAAPAPAPAPAKGKAAPAPAPVTTKKVAAKK